MFDDLSKKEAFVVAVFFGTVLLVLVDYLWNQQAWYFAILIVMAWPIEDKVYKLACEAFDLQQSTNPVRFAAYLVTILLAGIVAAFLGNQFLQPFHLPNIESLTQPENVTTTFDVTTTLPSTITPTPFQPINFSLVILVSVAVSIVAYVISNFGELFTTTDEYDEW